MFAWRARYWRLALLSLWISILASTIFSSQTLAANDPIRIISQTDTVSFPNGIDFQLSAHDTSSVLFQATIFLQYNTGNFQEQHLMPVPTPSTTITLRWHLDTTDDAYAPVGTEITYYWKLQDNAGNVSTSQTQKFQITDPRFKWQDLTQGMVRLHWYNRDNDFGQAILSQAAANLRRVSGNLGGGLVHPVDLWIYQSTDDFRGSLSPQIHEWVGGIAFPALNDASIVVSTPEDDTLVRDMPHELTHLNFHQLVAQNVTVPTWFDEGLAVYNQTYHEPAMTRRFKEALASHSLLRLPETAVDFPSDPDKAYLAYAQSWNLISYMYSSFGVSKMAALVKSMHDPQSDFADDLTHVLGVDQMHLEEQWRLQLGQPSILGANPLALTTNHGQSSSQLPSTTDSLAPLLLSLSIVLIVLPLFGLTGLLFYQRRSRQAVLVERQSQQMFGNAPLVRTEHVNLSAIPQTPAPPATEPWGVRPPMIPRSEEFRFPEPFPDQLQQRRAYSDNQWPERQAPQ